MINTNQFSMLLIFYLLVRRFSSLFNQGVLTITIATMPTMDTIQYVINAAIKEKKTPLNTSKVKGASTFCCRVDHCVNSREI